MTYLRFPLFIFGLLAIISSARAGEIIIKVDNLAGQTGYVNIALYDSKQSWDDKDLPAFSQFRYNVTADMGKKEIRWQIAPVPAGTYAVKAYLDEDYNGELNTNFIGIPKEKYALSYNSLRFGGASFTVSDAEQKTIKLSLSE